jgi:hypothetical protein
MPTTHKQFKQEDVDAKALIEPHVIDSENIVEFAMVEV